jgi:mRNA interferase MazF
MVLKNTKVQPLQGEIWLFDPDPTIGTEIGKKIRPGIIISNNFMNKGSSGLVFVIPLTSVYKGIDSHIKIDPPLGGLNVQSFALCEQIRSISIERLIKKIGLIPTEPILKEIRSWILDFTSLEIE